MQRLSREIMGSHITRDQIILVTAIKNFRRLILSYNGPIEGLKDFLLRHLDKKDSWADEVLAQAMEELSI